MKIEEYKKLYRLENNLWWFKGMRRILLTLLNKYDKRKNLKILDAGCGTGRMLQSLKNKGEASGLDISDEAIKFCNNRNLQVKKGTVESLSFKDNSFDLVTSIDVIYHKWVKSDKKAISEINRVLKKEGTLLIQVAAYNFMHSNHDRAVMTERRYTKKQLKKLLEENNFKIKKITYANTLLFPLALIKRLTEKKQNNSEVKSISKITNNILLNFLYLEAKLLKKINFPFGLSIIAVAKKN
ncbi:class I SAM-dependent methyltransferase [Candidatus Woesearchaeota archaeon]|jgi:ubiquinone/menaquinone biosynthesis C-methylase UbiE|nr:class I SAM-dependent methyltransferase [Candidatus Woesearchaeota archaeon]